MNIFIGFGYENKKRMFIRALLVYSLVNLWVVHGHQKNSTEITSLGDYFILSRIPNIVEIELLNNTVEIVLLPELDLNSILYQIKINKTIVTIAQRGQTKYHYQLPAETESISTPFNRVAVSWDDISDCIVFEFQEDQEWTPLIEWNDRSAPKSEIVYFGLRLISGESAEKVIGWRLSVPELFGRHTNEGSGCRAPRLSLIKASSTDEKKKSKIKVPAIG